MKITKSLVLGPGLTWSNISWSDFGETCQLNRNKYLMLSECPSCSLANQCSEKSSFCTRAQPTGFLGFWALLGFRIFYLNEQLGSKFVG